MCAFPGTPDPTCSLVQPGPRRGPRQMHRRRSNELECIFACEFSKCEQSLVRTQKRMHKTHCLNEHSFQASGPASASSKHRRLAARMGIQLRSRATPAARRPRLKAVPSRRIRGDTSLRVAKHAACAIPGWMLLASARVARHAACNHEKLTNCIMTDHRVLRPARLQIK